MKIKMKNKLTHYIDNQLFIFFLIPQKEKENNRLILDTFALPDTQDAKNQSNQNNPKNHGLDYQDIPGLCKSASLEDIRKNNYILTPG
jgi:type I restriction-modification system DNA methylase subunit